MSSIAKPARLCLRVLFFHASAEEFAGLGKDALLFGLACTWIVGVGRWWDDPRAEILQKLGLGSVVYVFVLAVLIWLTVLPLRPQQWSYQHVLTFITMTSPPALLYAVPVERFLSLNTAGIVNVAFLALVATWRVSLLIFYLRRHAGLSFSESTVAAALPIMLIIIVLSQLNLAHVAFEAMGGIREGSESAHDASAIILAVLSFLSFLSFIPFLIAYIFRIAMRRRRR